MAAAELIERIAREGVRLSAEVDGTLSYEGPREAVDRWLPALRMHKDEILRVLRAANDELAERHERWLIRYPDRVIEVWTDPPATREEVLASRRGAVDAEPIQGEPANEPTASCTTCAHRPPGNRAGALAPCGEPVRAGLSDRDGVIRYHPTGGMGCTAWTPHPDIGLEARIRRMAARWGYDEDDLERALEAARRDPAGWLRVVEIDEQGGVPC